MLPSDASAAISINHCNADHGPDAAALTLDAYDN
jgi:hypothetical protein